MRKSGRLFEIIQILRSHNNSVTAEALAEELEVSKRTIYRDIEVVVLVAWCELREQWRTLQVN